MAEKGEYSVGESPDYNSNGHSPVDAHDLHHSKKQGALAEAADIYGNVADAEEYGYVTRG